MRIECYEESQISTDVMWANFKLWSPESFEDSGIKDCYLALSEEGEVVGFQTISPDRECVAIEVLEQFRGQGIARLLIEESGCYRPEFNKNPSFWKWAEVEFA